MIKRKHFESKGVNNDYKKLVDIWSWKLDEIFIISQKHHPNIKEIMPTVPSC